MAIKALAERGSSASSIARTFGVTAGAVRCHLWRQAAHAVDGRGGKQKQGCGAARGDRSPAAPPSREAVTSSLSVGAWPRS